MVIKKIKKTMKKNVDKIVLVASIGFTHTQIPVIFPHLYYTITDPFITTPTEQRIEQKFGIDYEGDADQERQGELERNLQAIYETNPALLTRDAKIVLHSETVCQSPLVEPFLSYSGLTLLTGTVELLSLRLETLAHELAHRKHQQTPEVFNDELDQIFGDSYQDHITAWSDGSDGPRNGFVKPYGAKNVEENVATYVGKSYDHAFWENQELQKSDKYVRTLALLEKYDFISPKQFEEIKETLSKGKEKK